MYTGLPEPVHFTCQRIEPSGPGEFRVSDRQEKIQGWSQDAMSQTRVLVAGAGGLGGKVAASLVREGVGIIHISDPDMVEASNLNRQIYQGEDLGLVKGIAAAGRLSKLGYLGTEIHGYPFYFSELVERFPDLGVDLIVVGVDNNKARHQVSRWALKKGIPIISLGVSEDAGCGYVFVQEPGKACLGCYLGEQLVQPGRKPCPGVPASMEINMVVSALASYAIGSIVMARPRNWNRVMFFLATGESMASAIPVREVCPVCGGMQGKEETT